jgi:peptidyl-dipeptidase Dcp
MYDGNVTTPEIQGVLQRVSPLVSDFSVPIFFNKALFDRVHAVYEDRSNYSDDDRLLIEKVHASFLKNGIGLEAAKQERFAELSRELSQLGLKFSKNKKESQASINWNIQDEELLKGIPDDIVEGARKLAIARKLNGFLITYSMTPTLFEYADNPDVRERAYFMYRAAARAGATDNRPVVIDIAKKRSEQAKLLGYDTYADLALEDTMAGNKNTVNSFLEQIAEQAKPLALADYAELGKLKEELEGNSELKPWDVAYYFRLYEMRNYKFDTQQLRPYFELGHVQKGFFELAKRLYGINFIRKEGVSAWSPDVEVFEVQEEDGRLLGHVYMDFWEREGQKEGGAWSGAIVPQRSDRGFNERPAIMISMNLKKVEGLPTLLTPYEVETYFHEMGHAMHGIFANVKYQRFAGTRVARDFVELPSQLMEQFCFERSILDTFAFHYQTGERIPEVLFQAFRKSQASGKASYFLGNARTSVLDLNWHMNDLSEVRNVEEFEENLLSPYTLIRLPNDWLPTSNTFEHVFNGGYAARYYSYLWSQMLDADALEYMKENGLVTRTLGSRFRHLLEQGGSRPAIDLYMEFRGRAPKTEALRGRISGK